MPNIDWPWTCIKVDFATKYDVLYSKLESYSWLHYCLCCSQKGNHVSLMHCMSSFLSFPVEAQLTFTKAPLLFALKLLIASIAVLQYFSLPPSPHCVQNHQTYVQCSKVPPTSWCHSCFYCMLTDGINSDVILKSPKISSVLEAAEVCAHQRAWSYVVLSVPILHHRKVRVHTHLSCVCFLGLCRVTIASFALAV